MQETEIYDADNIGLRTKATWRRIDVYLRPLVDDLKILWKHGVPKVWDEYKREEFKCMEYCSPLSTTTRLIATSLARVKGKVQLAHTAWKILAQYD
jgi:hypothetical protein